MREKKIWKFRQKVLRQERPFLIWKAGFGRNRLYSHRSACVLPSDAPGRHSTPEPKRVLPWSKARLAIGLRVFHGSGPVAAESEIAASVTRCFRRPIKLRSRQMPRWKTRTKSPRTPPACSHVTKERLAGRWGFGSTLQLAKSVWVDCPQKTINNSAR